MGNCQYCFGKPRLRASILVVGLDNAGKTTTSKILQKLPIHNVAPTVGYSSDEFKFRNFVITMIDVGGGKKIRDIWKNYFAEIHGIVYVVDSSDHERLEEAKTELTQLLSNDLIKGKPVLLLANKQDKKSALDEYDICEKLNLEAIVNEYKCLCKVEMTSAMFDKKEKAVKLGITWLLSVIEQDFQDLNNRVVADVKERDIQIEEEMTSRRERIRLRKEELAAQEKEENSGNKSISNQNNSAVATEHEPETSSLSSIVKTVRSGLGDELLDDIDLNETDFNIPGSVPPSRNSMHPSSSDLPPLSFSSPRGFPSTLATSAETTPGHYDQNVSKSSDAATSWSFVNATDSGGSESFTPGQDGKRQNTVAPYNPALDQGAFPLPTGPSNKKLAPLNNPQKLSDSSDSGTNLPKLPPLLFTKPNADVDDDVVVT